LVPDLHRFVTDKIMICYKTSIKWLYIAGLCALVCSSPISIVDLINSYFVSIIQKALQGFSSDTHWLSNRS